MSPESAIADVMLQAVPHLLSAWDVDIWTPTEPAHRSWPADLHTFELVDESVTRALEAYDLAIYVLGNSPWHSRILPLVQEVPGLVVLHDVSMTDLVRHTALENGWLDRLVDDFALETSEEAAHTLRTAAPDDGPVGWLHFSAEHPLDDYAIDGSLGLVVHSTWHAVHVEGRTLGDVTVAPLPVPSTRLGVDENERATAARLLPGLRDDDLLLVTVGGVNANRRIDLLLDAVAQEPALSAMRVWAVGPADRRVANDLNAYARTLGLGDRFHITGRVTDGLLQDILARADLAATLRDPVLEGQSASVLTQMLAGTPVIVYDHAHYSELPDDAVVKIDVAQPLDSLRSALRALAADGGARARRGQIGRDYVLTTRGGEDYAKAILAAGARALAARPAVQLAVDLSRRLERLDLHAEPAVTSRVRDIAFDLIDNGQ